ncbi:hypothetical protein BS78_03G125200 [Paspalum vaginatum]|nr:hypothetical protein BS78_03G125200 [Paspalum vaginatum]
MVADRNGERNRPVAALGCRGSWPAASAPARLRRIAIPDRQARRPRDNHRAGRGCGKAMAMPTRTRPLRSAPPAPAGSPVFPLPQPPPLPRFHFHLPEPPPVRLRLGATCVHAAETTVGWKERGQSGSTHPY